MDDHTLQQVIDLAVKTAVLKAKKETILECRPIGSYFITETEDDPNILFGGGWQKLTGRYVLQCSDANHKVGTTVEAGLPDIQGSLVLHSAEQANIIYITSGAMTLKQKHNSYRSPAQLTETPNATSGGEFTFKASSYNSIYGNSDTVQPPARIVNVWKRVS